jgi:hypothetical protein
VVVAVVSVGMVQPAIDQVVHVVAVRNGLMAAAVVAAAAGHRLAAGRIGHRDGNGVLVIVPLVRVMQVAIVQIVHMPVVFDLEVPTVGAVDVGVVGMDVVCHGSVS